MARQPEVFVRELDPAEAQRLVKITRTARDGHADLTFGVLELSDGIDIALLAMALFAGPEALRHRPWASGRRRRRSGCSAPG
jgi:hypothetical protein